MRLRKLTLGVWAAAIWLAAVALIQNSRADQGPPPPGATLTVQYGSPGKAISPDLFGIFFEDINYAADGGLYAEQIQNRSFEYSQADHNGWNSMTAWSLIQRGGGQGTVKVDTSSPLNDRNPHYAVVSVQNPGEGVGLQNDGFDGIVVRAGTRYNLSLFARQVSGFGGKLIARLEDKSGKVLGETQLTPPRSAWTKFTAAIDAKDSAQDARLVLLATGQGDLALDEVSLFPPTFHDRPNGMRPDLAQVIADLHPKFVRFPGGCVAHGDGLNNIYRWKNTIGPVEQRLGQRDIWQYHQSVGLGFYEYFQFCEDIGAKPLPIVAAGVCCQNSGAYQNHKWGQGQQGLPMDQMPSYIQDVLDLIEYANGPITSPWGAKRAAAGHPAPFHLQYLGIGNEDKITPVFEDRFKMIYDAVKAAHPEITVIGTVGPFPDGEDYTKGWQFATDLKVPAVDEHYYEPPSWFLNNLGRYDRYDRANSKVYVGEYAAHDVGRRSDLRASLAEAAYLTSLERNGDVVRLSSYAPLLGKEGHMQWHPNLIYFNNTDIDRTVEYYAQQLFSTNSGDTWLPNATTNHANDNTLAVSSVRDSRTGDTILKIVNDGNGATPLHIELTGAKSLPATASLTVLTGDPNAEDGYGSNPPILPQRSEITLAPSFDQSLPANSISVIRIKGGAGRLSSR